MTGTSKRNGWDIEILRPLTLVITGLGLAKIYGESVGWAVVGLAIFSLIKELSQRKWSLTFNKLKHVEVTMYVAMMGILVIKLFS